MSSAIHLRTENLGKYYRQFKAVDNLSLDIPEGGIFGLLGPNGAGKSTTIMMICGLLKPSEGKVIFENSRGELVNSAEVRIGLCPQENIIWSRLSCMEQLVFTGQLYGLKTVFLKKYASDLLEKLGLSDKKNKLAQELSGGIKRRLNLALAIIHDPDIVILDEPETGLDPQSRVLVREFIRELGRSKTIILTTHNMDEAERLSDRVAIIDYGKLLVLDTVQNLKNSIDKGDFLEMKVSGDKNNLGTAIEKITRLGGKLSQSGNFLQYQAHDALSAAGVIREILKKHNIEYSDFHLRETSLEDVFMFHTGRSLRE